jgi:DNA-binding NarL/FixJ family response regulator
MIKKTRVLVADKLPIFSAGVNNLLTDDGGFEVVEARDMDEAVREVTRRAPDIVLIDLDLPPAGGLTALTRIASLNTEVRTIVWSLNTSRDLILATIRAGASGYLHKGVSPEGLVRALRGVTRGEAPLSRHVTQMVIDALHGANERNRIRVRINRLSEREVEVLDLIARGARNREIAGALAISEFTAKRHVQNILQKLELASRTAAGAFYRSTTEYEHPHAYEGANA